MTREEIELKFEEMGRKYFKDCKVLSPLYGGTLETNYKIYLKDGDDKVYMLWKESQVSEENIPHFENMLKNYKSGEIKAITLEYEDD